MGAIKQLFADQLPKLIAFDLDGTLVDSADDIAYSLNKTIRLFGRESVAVSAIKQLIGRGAKQLIVDVLAMQKISESTDSSQQVEAIYKAFLDIYAEQLTRSTRPYTTVENTLLALQGLDIPLVIITNKPKKLTQPLLVELNLHHYFQLVLSGDSLTNKKPHPEPLLHVAQKYSLQPKQCLMVGDSANDIEAAKYAGFKSVAVDYGYNHGQPVEANNPGVVIGQLSELL